MIEKIYNEIEALILLLREKGEQSLANVIDHRMYKVSWTTSSELLECIGKLLKEELEVRGAEMDELVAKKVRDVLSMIAMEA